jgi:PAS domain S-box-containing protein
MAVTLFPQRILALLRQVSNRAAAVLRAPRNGSASAKPLIADQEAVAANALRLAAILDTIPDIAWFKDIDGRFLAVNAAAARACNVAGPQAVIGRTDGDFFPIDQAEAYRAADLAVMKTGKVNRIEELLTRADGTNVWLETIKTPLFDAKGVAVGTIGIARDITERKRIERSSCGARSAAQISVLAGGIAHDFNNLLGAILGFATFIAEDSKPGGSVHQYASRILGATQRGEALVEKILTLSGQRGVRRSRFAMADMMEDMSAELRAGLPSGVTLHMESEEATPVVEADRVQLGEMLRNLCANAGDALTARGGTVRIAARPTRLEGDVIRRLTDRHRAEEACFVECWGERDTACAVTGTLDPSLSHVSLVVADDGAGMNGDVLRQAFTPFFTTKERARNAGLGLPVVQGIVLAHGGALMVRSRVDGGTEVEVILPDPP